MLNQWSCSFYSLFQGRRGVDGNKGEQGRPGDSVGRSKKGISMTFYRFAIIYDTVEDPFEAL